MKHATETALASISALLAAIRSRLGLTERKPGIFYRKGQAFLHFHEDPSGMFADIRDGAGWRRIDVTRDAGRVELLKTLDAVLTV